MLRNLMFRALLGTATIGVVMAAGPASADAKADARAKAKEAAKEKAKAKAKAEAKETAKEAAKEKAKAKAKAKVEVKEKKLRTAKAETAKADDAAKEAAAEAETQTHAKHMGMIERLEQIAVATSNDNLKSTVTRLKEKEAKRHTLAKGDDAA